jgi:hypothetical protein
VLFSAYTTSTSGTKPYEPSTGPHTFATVAITVAVGSCTWVNELVDEFRCQSMHKRGDESTLEGFEGHKP